MVDRSFQDNQVNSSSDTLLFEAQQNHMKGMLERVLQISKRKEINKKPPT